MGLLMDSQKLSAELDAVWQKHVTGIADQLFGAWRREVETVFARRGEALSQSVRRLRQAENHSEWIQALLDSASAWCSGAALFSILNKRLRCEAVRGLPEELTGIDVPLESAPAFANCVETQDPVAALATARELSASIAKEISGERVHLFPLVFGRKVQAVLLTGSVCDSGPLELLAGVAGVPASEKYGWETLTKQERQLHMKAQRFATVRVSQIRLMHSQEVEDGRSAGDLYTPLRKEIDQARDEFQKRFMDASPTMVDYLHLELMRILVNNENAQFGPNYPGPLA